MAYGRKEKQPVGKWCPKSIKDLRRRYDESQAVFCLRLGVSPDALQYWEQGRGKPSKPVELLLERLAEDIEDDSVRPLPEFAAASA